MNSIKERFLKELILDRQVKLKPNFYKMYYYKIFPCENEFKSFLSSNSTQQMIFYAKKIIKHMSFFSSYPLADFAYENLLSVETNSKTITDYDYVSQDHYVHTINIYILGIYLYFNHDLFHERLNNYFKLKRKKFCSLETQAQNSVKSFLSAWKYFSLAHDSGYPFEKLIKNDNTISDDNYFKIFENYSNSTKYILYELIAKSLSRLIFTKILFNQKTHSFGDTYSFYIETCQSGNWMKNDSDNKFTHINKDSMSKDLEFIKSHKLIPIIDSYEGIKNILPLIDFDNMVTVVKNANDEIVAINVCNSKENVVYIEKNSCEFTEEELYALRYLGSDEFSKSQYKCEYYISDFESHIKHFLNLTGLDLYNKNLLVLQSQIEYDKSAAVLLISSGKDIGDAIYSIYDYITQKIGVDALISNYPELWKKESQELSDSKLCEMVKEKLNCLFSNMKSQTHQVSENYDELCRQINDLLSGSQFKNDTIQQIENYLDQQSGVKQTIYQIISKIYEEYYEKTSSIKFEIDLKSKKKAKNIHCYPFRQSFSSSKDDSIAKQEFDRLNKELQKLLKNNLVSSGLLTESDEFSTFLDYKSHSMYDHGIMSAYILQSNFTLYKSIINNIEQFPFFGGAWPISLRSIKSHTGTKSDSIIIESIYSILIHNVYTNIYENLFGKKFKQDLSINPFAYFGAFCDNLQIWDRYQQIDQSKTTLRSSSYYGNKFDMNVINKQIVIICETPNIQSAIYKFRSDLDTYLKDASSFIGLSLTEE